MANWALNSKRSLGFAILLVAGVCAFAAKNKKAAEAENPEDALVAANTSKAAKEEIHLPVVKIPSRVQSLDWSQDGSLFSHTEGNTVTVRDGNNCIKVRDLSINGGRITDLKFASNFEGALEQIIMFSETSELSLFKSTEKTPNIIERLPVSSPPPIIEFSDDANFIALGRKDGGIDIYFQLYLTQNITRSQYRNPFSDSFNSNVKAISFSKDSKYVAALQENGRVAVWRVADRQSVAQISDINPSVPCILTCNNESLITLRDENTLQMIDFAGRPLLKINVDGKVSSFALSVDGETLIVLTKDNRFQYYSLRDGSYLGYIPAWNKTEVSSYSFSTNGQRLLVGHDDGSIYILDIDKVFTPKGKKPPVYTMEDVDTGEKWKYDAKNAIILGKDEMVVKKSAHNIEARAAYRYSMSKYYNHGVNAQLGYVNDRLIRKFYFGFFLGWEYFFSNDDYSWEYKLGNYVFRNPNLLGINIAFVVGKDWQIKKSDFKIFIEGDFLGGLRFITSAALGTGKPNTSLGAAFMTGVRWRELTLYASVGFDTVYMFNIGAGLSFKYRIAPPVKKPKTVQSAVEGEAKNAV